MSELSIWKIIIAEKNVVRLEKLDFNEQPGSINSASRLLPKGVYTTLRTYQGSKVLPLQNHLNRLEISAALLGQKINLNQEIFYQSLQMAAKDYLPGDTRIRFTVDLDHCIGDVYLSIEPLVSPSPHDYAKGVITITCPIKRENPESKQTSFIETAEKIRQRLPPEAHECLLLDERGFILEGLSSNFFYIREGKVRTAYEGILSGITRSKVISAAKDAGIPVLFEAAHQKEIHFFEEAFITSSTRSVLPVCQIDHIFIGNPGPLTTKIQAAYWESITNDLVDLWNNQ